MAEDLFFNPDHDPARFKAELEKKPGPIRNYIIFFTPRSGSSWLADIIKSTGKMGHPGEWLNPGFIPGITRSMNSFNPWSYFAILRRRQGFGRIFGMEVTYFQLNKVFPENEKLFEIFNIGCPKFYLIREDIVEQAVSLSKAVATNVYHSPQTSEEDRQRADTAYTYDPDHIAEWLNHIRRMEVDTEQFFERFDLTPQLVTYEEIMRQGEEATLKAFARALRVDWNGGSDTASAHTKIATSKSNLFAQRFREERSAFLDQINEQRAPLLLKAKDAQRKFFADARPGS